MTFKQKLTNQPTSYVIKNIIAKHADGLPLTSDERNFLESHEKSLSNPHVESAADYYVKHHTHAYNEGHSFLLPHEILNKEEIEKLKKRLQLMLVEKNKYVELKFTSQQFADFKKLTINELILYHGNQLLTGAPFFPGGIAPVIFFQWGNLFGVAKYVVLAEEHALKSNVLIYFTDMRERLLETCVKEYLHQHNNEPQNKQTAHIATPSLTLSRNKDKKEGD